MTTQTELDDQFRRRIEGAVATVQAWDADTALLEECRNQIPFAELRCATGPYSDSSKDAALPTETHCFVQRLARYFKQTMTWINMPACRVCHSVEHMVAVGTRGPVTEIQGQAVRVEVYTCGACRDTPETTFPRYNCTATLFQTRTGRCGEYANLFGLYCRAVGLETRYILDVTDHVWTEVYIESGGEQHDNRHMTSWCMVDSCEGVMGENSMYEHGWGKQHLSYIVAVSLHQVVDVTPKYTRQQLFHDAGALTARRRAITSSEDAGARVLQLIQARLRHHNSPPVSNNEWEQLDRRAAAEAAFLRHEMQQTSWGENNNENYYGRGRISGSMAWKVSRREAGGGVVSSTPTTDGKCNNDHKPVVMAPIRHFHVETYYAMVPPSSPDHTNTTSSADARLHIVVQPPTTTTTTRHEAIVVNGVACACVGVVADTVNTTSSLSVVVLDDQHFGCILQSQCLTTLDDLADFVQTLPANRIVAIVGKLQQQHPVSLSNDDNDAYAMSESTASKLRELGGFDAQLVATEGVLYVGQVLAKPDWAYCCSYKDAPHGFQLVQTTSTKQQHADHIAPKRKLWTVKGVRPSSVIGRLPESVMPLATQQLAGYEQKRAAFLSHLESNNNDSNNRCFGYTTKPKAPVYLLGETAYPFIRHDESAAGDGWNTFLLLPEQLVPEDDVGILDIPSLATSPLFQVPLDANFFVRTLGSHLLTTTGQGRIPTADALQNTRLVGLYFSAHWCGPCRSFTPVLAEMYELLKESFPTHGLEIVFVSSDRDIAGFSQYFSSMPWLAIPFESLGLYKPLLSSTYNVRGIPSLVILDSMSGQIVVPNTDTRQLVMQACSRGDEAIKSMFQSNWLDLVPPESKQMLEMLKLSCAVDVGLAEGSSGVPPVLSSYLLRKESKEKETRLQALIAQLVEEGMDLYEATEAAEAVEEVSAEEQLEKVELEAGTLNGQFQRTLLLDDLSTAASKLSSSGLASRLSKDSGHDQLVTVLSTALKYLNNCIKNPWTPKYRKFQLSYKVADKIARVPGGLQLLQAVGFEVYGTAEDYIACIPIYADLDTMRDEMNSLLARF